MQRSCPLYCSCRRRKLWQKRSTLGFSTARSNSCRTNRSEEHTSELQSPCNLVCRLLLEKKYVSIMPLFARLYGNNRPGTLLDRVPLAGGTGSLPVGAPDGTVGVISEVFFFFNEAAPPEIYTLPPHAPFPI